MYVFGYGVRAPIYAYILLTYVRTKCTNLSWMIRASSPIVRLCGISTHSLGAKKHWDLEKVRPKGEKHCLEDK